MLERGAQSIEPTSRGAGFERGRREDGQRSVGGQRNGGSYHVEGVAVGDLIRSLGQQVLAGCDGCKHQQRGYEPEEHGVVIFMQVF